MAWQTLDNNLSVKFDTTTSKTLNNARNLNFLFPFKVVTLGWLVSIGKYQKQSVSQISSTEFTKDYINAMSNSTPYTNSFTGHENYIPVADIILPNSMNEEDFPVLLIYNSEPYCIPVKSNYGSGFPLCSNSNMAYFSYPRITTPLPEFANFIQMGNVFTQNSNNVNVIINKDYLYMYKIQDTPIFSKSVYITQPDVKIQTSSIFGTVYLLANNILSQGFFDIVPGQILGDCCNGTQTYQLPPEICTNYQVGTGQCYEYLNSFCANDNLQTDSCYRFCSNVNNDCNTILRDYCTIEDRYKKLDSVSYNKTCACFMNQDFYQNWQDKEFAKLPENVQEYLRAVHPRFASNCSYPQCASSGSIPVHNANCDPDNIQICINKNTINADNMSDSVINVDSLVDCVAKINPDLNTKPPNAGIKLTITTEIIIGSVLLVAILVLVAFIFLRV